MERELHQAQDVWRKRIQTAEQETKDAVLECERLQDELASQHEQSGHASAGECELRRRVEEELARVRAENHRRLEELGAAAEVEAQLRRELASMDHTRLQLEDQTGDLALQLERAQTAYSEAVQEVGTMASRLDALEWGSQAKTDSEELVRGELSIAKERQAELERQLNEVTWMRDYSLQQVEEARAQVHRQREEAQRLEAERAAKETARAETLAVGDEVGLAVSSTGNSTAVDPQVIALESLRKEHSEELRRVAAAHREEMEFLRKRGDEKDRRLEVLICDRNALRLEAAEQSGGSRGSGSRGLGKDCSNADLEEGLDLRSSEAGAKGGCRAGVDSCTRDGDVVLRRFSRVLFVSRTMRGVFFGYLVLLHFWIWVILHHTASSRMPHA